VIPLPTCPSTPSMVEVWCRRCTSCAPPRIKTSRLNKTGIYRNYVTLTVKIVNPFRKKCFLKMAADNYRRNRNLSSCFNAALAIKLAACSGVSALAMLITSGSTPLKNLAELPPFFKSLTYRE
jgi:hypothetical protein